MINLAGLAQAQLEAVGYDLCIDDGDYGPIVSFENDSILGFAFFFVDARELMDSWRCESERVIREFNFSLRRGEAKSWNTYLIFLAEGLASASENIVLGSIEEDLVGTRKIARAGISNTENLRSALLSLLAIQNAPSLDAVDMPAEIRVRTSELSSKLVEAFLSGANDTIVFELLELDR